MTHDTVAVTGGSGFIGSHVVDALLGAGHAVRVLDQRPPLQAAAEWVEVDLLEQDALTDALKGCGPVFHLAAMADVNQVIAEPAESVAVTALGAARVLEAARRADAGRVILASTVWVYAATRGDVVDEETPFDLTADRHIYASSKLAAEMFCADYANLFGRPYTVLRYGIPFGPRMRSDLVVAAFLERALRGEALRIDGDGAQERSFVYVEDLAAAHVLALAPVAENRTYNLEANEPISIRQLAETVGALVGDVEVTFGPSRPGDYRAKRVQQRAGAHGARMESAVRLRGRAATHPRVVSAAMTESPATGPRTLTDRGAIAGYGGRRPRRIAVVPAYNEEPMVATVLEQLYPLVDELVVVDDGSTDGTRREIQQWLPGHDRCRLLWHDVNQGMSEAYILALTMLRTRLEQGELSPNDLVFTVDADGQHDLAVLNELVEITIDEGIDAMLARARPLVSRAVQEVRQLRVEQLGERVGGQPPARRRVGLSHLPARLARARARLLHRLQVQRDRRGRSRDVAARLPRAQRSRRTGSRVAVTHPPARRRDRRGRDPGGGGAGVAARAASGGPGVRTRRCRPHRGVLRDRGPARDRARPGHERRGRAPLRDVRGVGRGSGRPPHRAAVHTRGPRPDPGRRSRPGSFRNAPTWAARPRSIAVFTAGAALAAPAIRRPHPFVLGISTAILVCLAVLHERDALLVAGVLGVIAVGRAPRWPPTRPGRPAGRARSRFGTALVMVTFGMTAYLGASTVSAQWFGGGVTHGPRDSGEVAITFDDGADSAATPQIMRILDAAGVHATFFVVGQALERQPDVVRALYRHGHLVANHSFHGDEWRWLDPRYPELERAQSAFQKEIGACPAWFRPPNGERTPFMARVVHRHGMRMAMWDVSASNARHQTADDIADRVLRNARSGSIIDLRDGIDGASAANKAALVQRAPGDPPRSARRGTSKPVRLDELIGGPAYTSCSGHTS